MLTFLLGTLLSKDERNAIDTVTSGVSKMLARTGADSLSLTPVLGGMLGQLSGEEPLSGTLRNILEFTRQAEEKGYLRPFVEMGLENLANKGVKPEAVASLAQRLANHLRITPTYSEDDSPTETVALTLLSLADLHYNTKMGVGGVSICSNCGYAQLV